MFLFLLNRLTIVPPPSSDKRKWWLDHNASSRVEVPKPPGEGWILNPKRPLNPWDPSDEPDWIKATTVQTPSSSNSVETKPPSTGAKVPPAPPPRRRQTEQTPPPPEEKPDLPRRPTSASPEKQKPVVPPKPSFISSRPAWASSAAPSDDGEFKPAPPLPPKTWKQGDRGEQKDSKVGLLLDEDDDERFIGSWKPLQPSKEL